MQYISFYVWPCKAVTFIPFIFIVSKINVIVSGCHPIVFYISQTSNITNKRRRICYNLCSIYNFSRFVSSPQLLICCHLHYTSLPIKKIAYFMKLVGWEQLATQDVPRWQVHKRVAGGSQRRGSVASPVWFGADHDCGKLQPSGEEPSENAMHQPLGGV